MYGLLGASWVTVFVLVAVLVAVLMRGGDDPAAHDDIGARDGERSQASSSARASAEEMTAPATIESPVSPTDLTGGTPRP